MPNPVSLWPRVGVGLAAERDFPTHRPVAKDRQFVSDAMEAKIAEVKRTITHPQLAWLFENCKVETV